MSNFSAKKAFSLIEILQTVILLGIIAGISISFFRNMNTDSKLRDSTEIMIMQAIQEANKQMCSDTTPYCTGFVGAVQTSYVVDNANNRCATAYPGSAYDADSNFCIMNKPVAGCPAGMEEQAENGGNIRCFGLPKCYDAGGNQLRQTNDPASPVVESIPLFQVVCAANPDQGNRPEPQWNAQIRRTIGGNPINTGTPGNPQINEICYRLWDLVNHKRQGNNDYNDIVATCSTRTNACFGNANCTAINNPNEPVNMILPNGARLYNVSALAFSNAGAGAVNDGQHIFIKYDRNPMINTYAGDNDGTTLKLNAVRLGGPNNLECIDAYVNNTAGYWNGNENDANGNMIVPTSISGVVGDLYRCMPPAPPGGGDGGDGGGDDPAVCIAGGLWCETPGGWNNWVLINRKSQHNAMRAGWGDIALGGGNGKDAMVNEKCLQNQETGATSCAYCTALDKAVLSCQYGGYYCMSSAGGFDCGINGGEVSDIQYDKNGNVSWVRCNSWNSTCTSASTGPKAIKECKTALCSYNKSTGKWETGGSDLDKFFFNEFVNRWKDKNNGVVEVRPDAPTGNPKS